MRASAFLENVILYLNLNEDNVRESKLIVNGNNDKCISESDKDNRTPKVKRLVLLKMTNKEFIYYITALFTNVRIVKFKSQLTIAFSLPSIILTDLLGNKTLL